MENTTLFFNTKTVRKMLALAVFCLSFGASAQTTVTYSMGNTGYFATQTTGTSGTFVNAGTELGMYSNGGGTKNVVAYRNFMTAGNNTGSVRALQVGDVFSLQVYASSAFGQIGFSLNTSNVTTGYGTRNTNSRLYVQEDGTNGSWYVNSSVGNETLDYNVSSTYRNYLFKVYITSETTCDVELIVDGTTTKRLFNRTMNGAAGANITGFSLYLSDDWNGSSNANVYWKQVTEVRANTSVNLGYYLTSGNFTPGKITDGLEAGSVSTTSVNSVNIGGDSGTTIILNQANTYSGATTVNAYARGELQHAQALGNTSGATVSNNAAISLYSPTGITYNPYAIVLNGNGQNGSNGALRNVGGNNTWTGAITVATPSRINADITGSLTIGGNINLASALTVGGTQSIDIAGVISGAGGLILTGAATRELSAANTYLGSTSVAGGATLRLGVSNAIPDGSDMILNNATIESDGNSDTMGALIVESNSTIDLGDGSHELAFADSSAETWSGTLTITGWNGTAGQSNASGGRIFVGGLSSGQLSAIVFDGYSGTPIILPSGELVPPGPNLDLAQLNFDFGSLCADGGSQTFTFTIVNSGGDAAGITVESSHPEFTISNLSSTEIPNGGSATFDVTFAPVSAGGMTAAITIETTTPNSNLPLIGSAIGTGIAPTAYYQDADQDGYGSSAAEAVMSCTVPVGDYATNNLDCNDNNGGAHPGAVEIGYNQIDDDCDGSVDEGFPAKITAIQSAQCSNTLATIDTPIVANLVAGAQGYRWRITTMSGPNSTQVQELDTPLRTLKLTQLANYAFATQYKVEVAVYFAGYLQPYSASECLVSTPVAYTALASCNQTMTSMSNAVYANLVPHAAGYRFRITDTLNPLSTQVIERPVRDFKMSMITNFTVQYGKAYSVEVSAKNTDGTWMPFGSVCTINTPVFPSTSLHDSQCDDYLVPANSTQIYAMSYPGAIAYVFELSGSGLPEPIEVTKSMRAFTLNDFAGQLLPGATYNVRVRVVFNHADPDGPYGKICTIVTPGASRPATVNSLKAVAYPNPFADSFQIDIASSSNKAVVVKVYDMLGRLLEEQSVDMSKPASVKAGENYPSGVYNIVVSQGGQSQTLRVVKR